jgi:hypothetical protein
VRRRGAADAESKNDSVSFSGTIRSADESEGLAVVISVSDGGVVMQSADAELGRWSLSEVQIRGRDKTTFDFIAEGDQLIFTPEDSETFAAGPLVVREEAASGGRKRGRTKKRQKADAKASPAETNQVDTSVEEEADGADDTSRTTQENEKGPSLRMRMLDTARHNSLFDLDRVPIDENLRGTEHEHSWEHRVATGSGLASRVCTICGKIRLSKSS